MYSATTIIRSTHSSTAPKDLKFVRKRCRRYGKGKIFSITSFKSIQIILFIHSLKLENVDSTASRSFIVASTRHRSSSIKCRLKKKKKKKKKRKAICFAVQIILFPLLYLVLWCCCCLMARPHHRIYSFSSSSSFSFSFLPLCDVSLTLPLLAACWRIDCVSSSRGSTSDGVSSLLQKEEEEDCQLCMELLKLSGRLN